MSAVLAAASLLPACAAQPSLPKAPVPVPFTKAMPILPILKPTGTTEGVTIYELAARKGTTSFLPGTSDETYGYNGKLLGPTIRLRRGEEVEIRIHNELDGGQVTNVHWHGMRRIAASADGPNNDIPPGGNFTSRFTVNQPAATLWYHPHWANTGFQIYKGLAAFLYIEDEHSDTLALPREYGVNDFPVIVQDKSFYPDGRLAYMTHPDEEDRMLGDHIFVNGVFNPYLEVPRGMVRLRLLNVSNARRYDFAFEDGRTFHLIASDGGFLPAPAAVTSVSLGGAERVELLVDFSRDAPDARVKLVSRAFETWPNERGPIVLVDGRPELSPNAVGNPFAVMELRVARPGSSAGIPRQLVEPDWPRESAARVTRTFRLNDTGKPTINGLRLDMKRIDADVKPGATEIWAVINEDENFPHTFHVHGIQARVMDRTIGGMPVPLFPMEAGPKDTVLVRPGETVRLLGHFDELTGLYMFHCHVLEHEDLGMMGTFLVAPPGQRPADPPAHGHGR